MYGQIGNQLTNVVKCWMFGILICLGRTSSCQPLGANGVRKIQILLFVEKRLPVVPFNL